MKINSKIFFILSTGLIALLLGWKVSGLGGGLSSSYPNQPIQVVVPYNAGGGSDTFARIFQKSISATGLLPQPMVIINQPGGGGTIGSRYVMDSRPNGYRLLVHHEAMLTSELSGTVSFGPDDFEAIAQTGSLAPLVLVRGDSRFNDLNDLISEAKEKPKQLRFGADVGSLAHFMAMEMESSNAGSQFNYISTGGGQKRFSMLLGGHLEAGIFTLSEYVSFKSSGDTPLDQDIKVIALLTGERNAAIPDVLTAMEQGVPVDTGNAFYWWAPKGTPQAVQDRLAEVLEKTLYDPAVVAEMNKLSIGLDFRKGEALETFLDTRQQTLSAFAVSFPSELPDFPAWVMGIVVVLGVWIVIGAVRTGEKSDPSTGESDNKRMATGVVLVLVAYVASLQFGVAYAFATAPGLFLLGGIIGEWEKSRLWPISHMALLFTLGSEFIFTAVFSVPLP